MSESLQEKKSRIRALLGQRPDATPVPLPVISADEANRYATFPMTGVQQAYWLGRSGVFALGNISTHVYFEIELRDLDLSRLERAWNDLIARHEMLRVVVSADGMQRVLPAVGTYRIVCDDLREYSEAARERYLADLREQTSHRIFQLTEWPLFEVRVARREEHLFRIYVSLDMFFADTRSFRILLQELDRLYEDPSTALSPLTISFRDYVLGLEKLRATELYERARAYWTKRALEMPPAPDLPIAKDPSAITRPRFRRRSCVLDATTWTSLRDRAKQAGLTPSALLVSAYARVLGRWSRGRHFTLNLTFSNRLPIHPEADALVGDFTSLLLLEVDDRDRQSFADFATRTQSRLWSDMEHRCFDGIEVLRIRNRRTATPLIMPVVFTSILGARTSTDSGGPLARALFDSSTAGTFGITQTSQVWLDNVVSEADGRLTTTWDALEELFRDGVLDAMFSAYESLLVGLAAGTLNLRDGCEATLPEAQVDRRRAVNATATDIPDCLLHDFIREQARRRPFARALVQGDIVLDFASIDRCSNVIAQTLRARGARPNELIAVVMVKGWEQIVGVLGILYSGAAYLPIDADLPQQRIASLLAQGGVRIVLTQRDVAPRVAWPAGIELIPIDTSDLDRPFDGIQTSSPARAEDLAYVIFTSGSTGVPKGVMIDHRGAVNTIADMNRRFTVGAEDRVLGVSSLTFDLSVYDIFGVMGSGGTLVLPDRSRDKDVGHWIELVTKHEVTMWNSVPIIAQLLVDDLTLTPRPSAIASLRLVLMSGDWIPLSLPGRLKAQCPDALLVSLGGATEASIWSIVHVIDRVDDTWRSIPYGTPLGNQRFHVLGPDLSPAPDWVAGGLFIAGDGLAKGYWRDERATAQAFFEHPVTGERLYRTGDLGRYWPDGTIEFLGREDTQVKIHGHRIELGEIEAALRKDARVRDAVVVVRDAKPGDPRLVAYVLPADTACDEAAARVAHRRAWQETHEESCAAEENDRPSSVGRDVAERLSSYTGTPSPEDEIRDRVDETVALGHRLRGALADSLPRHLVPAAVVVMAAWPLTPNGKLDARALPPPQFRPEAAWQPPRVPDEERLCALFSQTLGVSRVGIHDNFFELGGDSLSATRIISAVRSEFHGDDGAVPLDVFWRNPTVAAIAELVALRRGARLLDENRAQMMLSGEEIEESTID